MKIHGWEVIIPQLAAYFVALRRRENGATPLNLFLTGAHGTNKTEGAVALGRFLEHTVERVDSSTLDDVSELAGIVDLQANRQRGESRIIEGDMLGASLLVLDEFLNTRPHVMPQFRLLLQGHLVLLAKKVPVGTRGIVGTGNLSDDMLQGEANLLDSPTADRFAMVVAVPSITEMNERDVKAILMDAEGVEFAKNFSDAIRAIEENLDEVSEKMAQRSVVYTSTMIALLKGTPYVCEGRRAKLLRQFFLCTMALCKAQPNRDRKEALRVVARDCLSYHKLSGVELDESAFTAAHVQAFELAMGENPVEARLASTVDAGEKLSLVVEHLDNLSPITKADVLGRVLESDNLLLKLAALELVRSPLFAQQPAELKAMIERIDFSALIPAQKIGVDRLLEMSQLSGSEALVFGLAGGCPKKIAELDVVVKGWLRRWKVV